MEPNTFVEQYQDQRHKYEKLTRKLHALVTEILEHEGIKHTLECRTKDVSSFRGKINRAGKNYTNPLTEITDLSGIRIILYSLSDIELVADLIKSEFLVDSSKSVDKMSLLDVDRFGYLSQHFIVRASQSRKNLREWEDIADLPCEIQVRTLLQHTWASVEHFLVYKNENDAPKSLRRRLYRLSALFELADEELSHLIQLRKEETAKYQAKLLQGNTAIELNADSLVTYLESSSEFKELINKIESTTYGQWMVSVIYGYGDMGNVLNLANYVGISSIDEVQDLILEMMDSIQDYYRIYFENVTLLGGEAITKMLLGESFVLVSLIFMKYAERFNAIILGTEFNGDWMDFLTAAQQLREEPAE